MKTWNDIYYKHLGLGADNGYAAFAADEYERQQNLMAAAMKRHFQKEVSGLFFPKKASNEPATTCTATPDPPPLTLDTLHQTMALMARPRPKITIQESIHCTVDRVSWSGGEKTWRKCSLSARRGGAALVAGLVAAALSSWIIAILAALLLLMRQRGWHETKARVMSVQTVPNPNLYMMESGVTFGHPATVANLRMEAERRGVEL